ncbi:MAG: SGNH/GDSL hydrolase family protein [Abditibacteriota bacterium]|nr:SGNH/GDSL hydrolase family protein [Abditibacteriota bacterium]
MSEEKIFDERLHAKNDEENTGLKWIEGYDLGLQGRPYIQPNYHRLTDEQIEIMKPVSEWVPYLSTNGAGLHIDFTTNSRKIDISYTLESSVHMPHMPITGSHGMDLYIKDTGKWEYYDSIIPEEKTDVYKSIVLEKLVPEGYNSFSLNLPLYQAVTSLKIGIEQDCEIKADLLTKKPVVIYGTSITQGGCASRPGMAYTNILRRNIDRDVYNLGFSGSGKCEYEMTDILLTYDAEIFIFDPIPNLSNDKLSEDRYVHFYEKYREKYPNTPLILLDDPTFLYRYNTDSRQCPINETVQKHFNEWSKTDKNLYYIYKDELYGTDGEATVDRCHATDLGFMRMSKPVIKLVKKLTSKTSAGGKLNERF